MSVNKVFILGNLGHEPTLRKTEKGTPVCNFSVATNEVFTNKKGESKKITEWHKIVTWGHLANNCNKYLQKGSTVHIKGRIQNSKWEREDGQVVNNKEIIAYNVEFLRGIKGGQNDGNSREYTSTDNAPIKEEYIQTGKENVDINNFF